MSSLRHVILPSDWSVGSNPFCKQTEMDLTPFEKKVIFLCHFCSLFHGNFNFSLVSSYRATKNQYIKTKKSNLMKNGSNPFCKQALHLCKTHYRGQLTCRCRYCCSDMPQSHNALRPPLRPVLRPKSHSFSVGFLDAMPDAEHYVTGA